MKKIIHDIQYIFLFAVISLLGSSCNDQWDDHVAINEKTMQGTVLDAIKENSDFSSFYEILKETGYDEILAGDYEFTVLAPNNAAVASYSKADKQTKLAIVKNHIAFIAYNTNQLAGKERLSMVNGKNMMLSSLTIDTNKRNIVCNNGILHMVNKVMEPAKSIDEYLQSIAKETYIQIDSLYAKTVKVMDSDKSIQTGVDENGQAVYDTVWKVQNYYLDAMPINNEDSMYTFVLLDNENFNTIKAKYAKYMRQINDERTDSLVTDELIRDLVFRNEETTALSGVKVDFSHATVVSEYKASNGLVKVMKGVDIKMKENKIKTIWVEGESYLSALNADVVSTRMRPWARGGKDIMVSSTSMQTRDSISADDGVTVVPINYTFTYNTNKQNKDCNFYLRYVVKMNSVDYDIYWLSYDDMEQHIAQDKHPESTLRFGQKLFASMPFEKVLSRADNNINNNYLGNQIAFGARSTAGIMKEEHLCKYALDVIPKTIMLNPIEEDPYTFTVPRMGKVTLMVCNTAEYSDVAKKSITGGMMFLDYIKFVPRVEEGD